METQTRHGAEIIWRHILTKRPILQASKESDSPISPKEINNLPHSDRKRPFFWVPDVAGWVGGMERCYIVSMCYYML